MRFLVYLALLLSTFLPSSPVSAQSTYFKDLSDRSHVPLYDCSIYFSSRDRDRCLDLSRGENVQWENEGYAVSCFDLRRSRRESCLRLADEILFDNSRLSCLGIHGDLESQRQCQITKRAYLEGRFQDLGHSQIVRSRHGVISSRTCNENAYEEALERWRAKKEEQKKSARTKTAIGVAATIGGIILSGSRDRGTQGLGQGLALGGVLLTSWGLVEMSEADNNYPHMNPACKKDWTQESRMVVVERQECVTTQYTQSTGYSSRSYYEVRCSNKRYVTFEEFKPWREGRPVTYYRY